MTSPTLPGLDHIASIASSQVLSGCCSPSHGDLLLTMPFLFFTIIPICLFHCLPETSAWPMSCRWLGWSLRTAQSGRCIRAYVPCYGDGGGGCVRQWPGLDDGVNGLPCVLRTQTDNTTTANNSQQHLSAIPFFPFPHSREARRRTKLRQNMLPRPPYLAPNPLVHPSSQPKITHFCFAGKWALLVCRLVREVRPSQKAEDFFVLVSFPAEHENE